MFLPFLAFFYSSTCVRCFFNFFHFVIFLIVSSLLGLSACVQKSSEKISKSIMNGRNLIY